jgi:hypothetical protein
MNNSNDFTKNILQTLGSTNDANNIDSGLESTNYTTNSGSGILDYLKSITWYTWILIILVLSFLGFNIFIYLGKGTQGITDFFHNIYEKIQHLFVMNNTDEKKTNVNNETDIHDDYVLSNKNATPPVQGTKIQNTIPQPDLMKNNSLNQALNKNNVKQSSSHEYEADDTNSNIQKGPSKSGYCYIGEDKGYRSCVYVKESDTCMSGDIFPTNDICVNPTLRT